jgi:hypothetical protein
MVEVVGWVHCVPSESAGQTGVISTPPVGACIVSESVATAVAPSNIHTCGEEVGSVEKAAELAGAQLPYRITVNL